MHFRERDPLDGKEIKLEAWNLIQGLGYLASEGP